MPVENEEELSGPILEQDEETAADTAAPTDEISSRPRTIITLDQMWTWLYDETAERKDRRFVYCKERISTAKLDSDIDHLTSIANSIAFLIDNEHDIREFVRAKRERNKPAAPQRRFGGRKR